MKLHKAVKAPVASRTAVVKKMVVSDMRKPGVPKKPAPTPAVTATRRKRNDPEILDLKESFLGLKPVDAKKLGALIVPTKTRPRLSLWAKEANIEYVTFRYDDENIAVLVLK